MPCPSSPSRRAHRHARIDDAREHVLHDRVRLRHDTDAVSLLADEPCNHVRADIGLAGARRTLHGQIAAVEVVDGAGDLVDRVAEALTAGERARARARNPAQQQVGRGVGRERCGAQGRSLDDRVGPLVDRRLLRPGLRRRGRCGGDRQLLPGEP
jgi:hypothetical protein